MLPDIDKRANIRSEWTRELDSGGIQEFVIDANVRVNHDWRDPYADTEDTVKIIRVYQITGEETFKSVKITVFDDTEFSDIESLLVSDYNRECDVAYDKYMEDKMDASREEDYSDYSIDDWD